jgi:isoquinoline 1-oxidoreductase alpha subunit
MAALSVNGTTHQVDVDPNTPLLWVLRETIGLTGTKYGCGIAQCGACTVHVDGVAMRSCSVPLSAVDGRKITTIEGLAQNPTDADIDANISNICRCGTFQQVRTAIHAAANA